MSLYYIKKKVKLMNIVNLLLIGGIVVFEIIKIIFKLRDLKKNRQEHPKSSPREKYIWDGKQFVKKE